MKEKDCVCGFTDLLELVKADGVMISFQNYIKNHKVNGGMDTTESKLCYWMIVIPIVLDIIWSYGQTGIELVERLKVVQLRWIIKPS